MRILRVFLKAAKDWSPVLSLILSISALLISFLIAYFTTPLIAKDNVRVVIGRAPTFLLTKKGDISVSGDSQLTFINSGNRQAAIVELAALITKVERRSDPTPNCRTSKTTRIGFTESAFVMKPGDIEIKQPEMFLLKDKNGTYTIPKGFFSDIYSANANDVFLACLSLTIITPDSYSKAIDQPIYKYVLRAEDEPMEDPAVPLFAFGKPVIMLQRSHPIFWE